jgi:hypothetical protein
VPHQHSQQLDLQMPIMTRPGGYAKWFASPIPPSDFPIGQQGLNLNLPLNATMRKALAIFLSKKGQGFWPAPLA